MAPALTPRIDPFAAAPETIEAVLGLEGHLRQSDLDHSLIELVKIRASQINGCAFCLHMHLKDARDAGESEERLGLIAAWHDSPLFSPRERAALGWTETLTLVSGSGAPDGAYEALTDQFSPREQVQLTVVIGQINLWNRLAVGFRRAHPAD